MKARHFWLKVIVLLVCSQAWAQTVEFTVPETACLEEEIILTNSSTDAESVAWDFCTSDLEQLVDEELLFDYEGASLPHALTMVDSMDTWYGFVTSRGNNKLYRLAFPGSLLLTPDTLEITVPGGLLSSPYDMQVLPYNGRWYGFILNSSGSVVHLDFGEDLSNTSPAGSLLSGLGELGLSTPRYLEIHQEGGDYIGLVSNFGTSKLTVWNMGSSLSSPSLSTRDLVLSGGSGLLGFSVDYTGSSWVGLVASFSNSALLRVDFGAVLDDDTYTESSLTSDISGLASPTDVAYLPGTGLAYMTTSGSNLYRLDFGSNLLGDVTDTVDPIIAGYRSIFDIDFAFQGTDWVGLGQRNNGFLYRYTFPKACEAGTSSPDVDSLAFTPTGLSYSTAGTKYIRLTAEHENSSQVSSVQSLIVEDATAPSITFTVDENRCILNVNTFNSTDLSGDVTSYSWDFNGEGSSAAADTVFQFETLGEKTISLTVSNASGCSIERSEVVTIYPEPPVPSFEISPTTLCSNTALTFTNTTDETGFDDVLSYEWDLGGIASQSADTSVVFTNSGNQLITLQSSIPGCSSDVLDSTIVLSEGPEVLLGYSNNCLDSAVQFVATVTGDDTGGYAWDFDGDAVIDESGAVPSTTFTYPGAGDYSLSLTVTSSNGCVTEVDSLLQVNGGPLISIDGPSNLTENISTSFLGVDETFSDNEVTQWLWLLDGDSIFNDQSLTLILSDIETNDLALLVETTQGCRDTVTQVLTVEASTSAVVSFSTQETACLEEEIVLSNTTVNASTVAWDFCTSDLEQLVDEEFLFDYEGASLPHALTMVDSLGAWYGFVTSRDNNKLYRLAFPGSLLLTADTLEITVPDGLLSSPYDLQILPYDGRWYGFILNSSGSVVHLDFGEDLSNTSPAGSLLSGLGELGLSTPRYLEIHQEGGDYIGLVSNFGTSKLTVWNMGSSLSSPSLSTRDLVLSGGSGLLGFSVDYTGSSWVGLVASFSNSALLRVDFGAVLDDDTYTESSLTSDISGLAAPTDVAYLPETGLAYLTTSGSSLYRLDFGNNLQGSVTATVDPVISGYSGVFDIDFAFQGTDWVGLGQRNNGFLYRYTFPKACEAGTSSPDVDSLAFTPTGLSYSTAGTKYIRLTAEHENSSQVSSVQSLIVEDATAPSITFTVDENRCILNVNTFNSTDLSGDVTSYSWDFNGEGSSAAADTDFQFETLGEKTISLTVSNASGCSIERSEVVTIYPEPPVPSFEISPTTLCSNTALTFTNTTDETGFDDVLSYEWDLGGIASQSADTSVVFTNSGNQLITLQSSIPGCSSDVLDSTIVLSEGPEVLLSYSNNCLDSAVQFVATVTGDDTGGYAWDFDGDAVIDESGAVPSTTFTYPGAGDYPLSLKVTSSNGCVIEVDSLLQVNGGPLISIDGPSNLTENISTSFLGVDETFSDNEVTQWLWLLDGDSIFNDQSLTLILSDIETNDLALLVETTQGCRDTVTQVLTVEASTSAAVSFSAQETACLEEEIVLSNTTVNASTVAWDFCTSDLDQLVEEEEFLDMEGTSLPHALTMVDSLGAWYGFVTSRDNNKLYRLAFPGSLLLTADTLEITVPDGLLSSPYDLQILSYDGRWYGFILNSSGSVVHLDFGEDLSNTSPAGSLLSGLGELGLSTPRYLEIHKEGGDYIGLVSNFGTSKLTVWNMGSSLSSPSLSTRDLVLSGGSGLLGFSVDYTGSSWVGLVASFSNSALLRVDFGAVLDDDTYTESSLTSDISGLAAPTDVAYLPETGLAYLTTSGSSLYRLDFGNNLLGGVTAAVDPVISGYSGVFDIDFAYQGTDWVGLGQRNNGFLYRYTFPKACEAGTSSPDVDSLAFMPTGLSYSTAGTKYIRLTAEHANGSQVSALQEVTVLDNTAPSLVLEIDSNRCILNSNQFGFTDLNGDITSYDWDFGDGNSSTSLSPQHTYGATGDYIVRLEVSNGGCTSVVSDTISIYPEPPTPVFIVADDYCAATDFQLTNTTDTSAFNGDLAFSWTVVELDSTFIGTTPTLNVPSGQFMLEVQSSVPGCSSEVVSRSLTVIDSPTSDFTISATCFGEITSFSNLSTGANSYFWNFGDSATSTLTDPDYLYSAAGEFAVTLTTFNDTGCSNVKLDTFKVESIPKAGFRVSLPCEGEVTLTDTSTVQDSDIVSWQWLVAGELLSVDSIPELGLDEPGIYEVTGIVESAGGCQDEATRQITVLDAAEVDFSFGASCDGSPFSFADQSITENANRAIAYAWNVNGTTYEDSSFVHAFGGPGYYPVTLTVTTENLCTATLEDSIQVLEAPILGFEVGEICQNTFVSMLDTTIIANDTVTLRNWLINDVAFGNGRSFIHRFGTSGVQEVTLAVTTASGCEYQLEKTVDVLEAPLASFASNTSFGGPGTEITFQNLSEGSDSSIWLVDEEFLADDENLTRVFTDPGTYQIDLVTFSGDACTDTMTTEVLIREPLVDLVIQEMALVHQDEDFSSIVLSVVNRSNLPVDNLRFTIQVEDQLPTQDRIETLIGIGQSRVIQLDAGVPNLAQYICVQVESVYDAEDLEPDDNESCITIEPQPIIEPPFPNPARDQTTIRTVLPVDGDVTITLLNVSGKTESSETYRDLQSGLHAFPVILAPYEAGLYFIRIEYGETSEIIRIVKQ